MFPGVLARGILLRIKGLAFCPGPGGSQKKWPHIKVGPLLRAVKVPPKISLAFDPRPAIKAVCLPEQDKIMVI